MVGVMINICRIKCDYGDASSLYTFNEISLDHVVAGKVFSFNSVQYH